jgi:hypothetical protein
MAAGLASFAARAFRTLALLALLAAGWAGADLTFAASGPPQFLEELTAGSPEPDKTPRADARSGAPPYAIARKPAGSGRSEHKRLQPSDGGSSDHAAAPADHVIPPPASQRRADLLDPIDRAAASFRGFRFLSRAPPAFGLC